MTGRDMPQRPSGLEKHAQTIIGSVILALLVWVGTVVAEIPAQNATVNAKLESMQEDIKDLQQRAGTRYTKADAQRDWFRNDKEISEIKERLKAIEMAGSRR